MKKNIATLFFAVHLLFSTQLHELLKFPMLIEHFIEHRKENNELSFIDFLYIHYANDNVQYADNEQDMKLPFKSHTDYSVCSAFISLPNNTFSFPPKKPVFFEIKPSFPFGKQLLADNYLSSIWQPPQV